MVLVDTGFGTLLTFPPSSSSDAEGQFADANSIIDRTKLIHLRTKSSKFRAVVRRTHSRSAAGPLDLYTTAEGAEQSGAVACYAGTCQHTYRKATGGFHHTIIQTLRLFFEAPWPSSRQLEEAFVDIYAGHIPPTGLL